MKLTKRKGFNFFRSYYDVYNELENEADKIAFIEALLNKQFQGIDPIGLEGMARFAWVSQYNSIDNQVKGWEGKTNIKLIPTEGGSLGGSLGGSVGGSVGGSDTPSLQGEEKEEEKEKGKEKEKEKKSMRHLKINDPPLKPKIDFNNLIQNYHRLCEFLPVVKKLTKQRKAIISARIKIHGKEQTLEVLKKAGKSEFLNGVNDRAWKANIDFIFKEKNFVNILEGVYDNNAPIEKKKEHAADKFTKAAMGIINKNN